MSALTMQNVVGKMMSMLFNGLPRFIIAFLPRSKYILISCLQSTSSVILEPKKIKSATVSIFSPSICYEVMEPDAMILVFFFFFMLSFKSTFPLSPFTFIKRSFAPLHFLPLGWCHLHIVSCTTQLLQKHSSHPPPMKLPF